MYLAKQSSLLLTLGPSRHPSTRPCRAKLSRMDSLLPQVILQTLLVSQSTKERARIQATSPTSTSSQDSLLIALVQDFAEIQERLRRQALDTM